MKEGSIGAFSLIFMFVLLLFVATGPWLVSAQDMPISQLSEEKRQKWEGIQKALRYELSVCREHCAYDKACEAKCESAFRSRLEKEYKGLTHESR